MSNGLVSKLSHSTHKRLLAINHSLSAAFNSASGLHYPPRAQELIVSLTTIPERLATVHRALDALLRQSLKPDRLILWLNPCAPPGRPAVNPDSLPPALTRLTRRGLTLRWCPDIGPYCKLIPALRAHRHALIATADDDVYYPPDWLGELFAAYQRHPDCIPCHRAHRMTFDAAGHLLPYRRWEQSAPGIQGPSPFLFPTGVGGILYAPAHLHPDVTNESLFLTLCPKADDVWLKAMAVLNGTPCHKVAPCSRPLFNIPIRHNRKLVDQNVRTDGNDLQLRNIARHYPAFAQFLYSGILPRPSRAA